VIQYIILIVEEFELDVAVPPIVDDGEVGYLQSAVEREVQHVIDEFRPHACVVEEQILEVIKLFHYVIGCWDVP
jgi:hypothetical protein